MQRQSKGIRLSVAVKILLGLVALVHLIYLGIFRVMGEEMLATANIFSVCIYIFALKLVFDAEANAKIAIAIFQVEVLLHASTCIVVLGWGYGFELLFLVSTVTMFFSSFSYKHTSYGIIALQILISSLLFVLLDGKPIRPYDVWRDVLFVFNISMVTAFAIIVSYLLELSNTFIFLNILSQKESIKTIVNHDPLTGLLNRASMQAIIEKKELFEGREFAVVMGDIDDFKKINDSYGHGAGDEVLTSISQIFTQIFRKSDYVARWGGEEFLAILCGTKKQNAISVVDRVKEILNENVVEYKNVSIKATMTFGVVTYGGVGKFDIQAMIKQADELLYDGKRSGKNRIMHADFSPAV